MKKIMLIEDERIVRADLKDILENCGYQISAEASSGEEALEKVSTEKPDLILMDIRLEGEMDGIHTARLIREEFDIPIIYLTAYADKNMIDRAKVTEPYGYIVKPFNEKQIHSIVEITLHKHAQDRNRQNGIHGFNNLIQGKVSEITFKFKPDKDQFTNNTEDFTIDSSDNMANKDRTHDITKPPAHPMGNNRYEESELHKPIYQAKEAEQISGITINLIRLYERMGIIKPYRNEDNNYRFFTMDEIQWVKRVKDLIHVGGLNIKSIRQILTLKNAWEFVNTSDHIIRKNMTIKTDQPCWSSKSRLICCRGNHKCYNCPYYVESKDHPKLMLENLVN